MPFEKDLIEFAVSCMADNTIIVSGGENLKNVRSKECYALDVLHCKLKVGMPKLQQARS